MIDHQSRLALRTAHQELLRKLHALEVPKLDHCSTPDQLLGVKEHLEEIAKAVDAYVEKVGEEATRSTTAHIDDRWFRHLLFGALDGYALFELEKAADEIREEERQAA